MECRQCGYDNHPMARECAQCGASLGSPRDDREALPLSRTSRRNYTFSQRPSPAARYDEEPFVPASRRREPSDAPRDGDTAAPRRSRARAVKMTKRERELYAHRKGLNGSGHGSMSNRRSPAAFRILLIVIVIAVLGIGGMWGASQLWGKQIAEFTDPGPSSDDQAPDIKVGTSEDGKAQHILTFYGEAGDYIYIKELQKNYYIETDNTQVFIPDSLFTTGDPNARSVDVTLHPTIYSPGKKPRELAVVTYTIDVPPSPIAVVSPEGKRATWYSSIYLVKIEVLPGSRVSIGGTDVSDMIDTDNIISHNVEVQPIGDNVVNITVSSPGYRTNTERVVIDRPYMDIPIEVDVNATTNSTARNVRITGKTTPGATLTIAPNSESVEVDDEGNFEIRIRMTRFGANTYTITASMPGKQDSTIDHTIVYSPNIDEYSAAAWSMDYEDLIQNQAAYQSAIYVCTGTLEEVLSEKPYIFTYNVGTETDKKLVVIEQVKDTIIPLTPGTRYRVYADLEGTYEGLPRFNGRFVYED